jgi:hypothetical protein
MWLKMQRSLPGRTYENTQSGISTTAEMQQKKNNFTVVYILVYPYKHYFHEYPMCFDQEKCE